LLDVKCIKHITGAVCKSEVVLLLLCTFERERKHTYDGKFMIISGTLVKLFIDNLIVVIFEGRCDNEPV